MVSNVFIIRAVWNIQIMIMIGEIGMVLLTWDNISINTNSVLFVSRDKTTPNMHFIIIDNKCGFYLFSHFLFVFCFLITLYAFFWILCVSCLLFLFLGNYQRCLCTMGSITFSNFSCMFLNPNNFFPIWILIVLIY